MPSIRFRKVLILAFVALIALAILGLVGVVASPDGRLLEDGYSALRAAQSAVRRVVGSQVRRWVAGSGQAATEIWLYDPVGLVEDRAGNLYFADRGEGSVMGVPVGRFIWRIAPDNTAEIIAGTGAKGTPGDGEPALEADLGAPAGLAMDSEGRLYFADPVNHLVMRIEADGRLRRIAGTGEPGYAGDGGPARMAPLNEPYDVDLDAMGNLYIADRANHRVRKVTPEGVITTVAGTGVPGYQGDHGPAAQARLNGLHGANVHPDGRLLIADSGNHVVRQVAADGTITTLAGTGEAGNSGDGGAAVRARLSAPRSLFVDAVGRVYVGDEASHNVRVVDPGGTITTLIGDGAPGYAMIGQPVAAAPLNDPQSVLVRAIGGIVVSDGDTGRLLTFEPNGKVALLAGPAEHSIGEALARFGDHDAEARRAYEKRVRAAGLKE
jgi:sugar lactone lactonase YvrE